MVLAGKDEEIHHMPSSWQPLVSFRMSSLVSEIVENLRCVASVGLKSDEVVFEGCCSEARTRQAARWYRRFVSKFDAIQGRLWISRGLR